MRSLVWFRGKDLRIADHEPLTDAVAAGEVLPLFVIEPALARADNARERPHHVQFLLDAVNALALNLADRGSRLLVVPGEPCQVIPKLVTQWRVDRVLAQARTEPAEREVEAQLSHALGDKLRLYAGETLASRGFLRNGEARPYAVFTPFSRAFFKQVEVGTNLRAPKVIPPVPAEIETKTPLPTLADVGLGRNMQLQAGGERCGQTRLKHFVTKIAAQYEDTRDRMDLDGTSRLSADLKFGTLSVRQVWNAMTKLHASASAGHTADSVSKFLTELVWREFTHATLWDRPELVQVPFRSDFAHFPWREDQADWTAWVRGNTGYPVVDAAARQLLAEGFVHNRARMIAASFLTKHLMLSYQRGESHYMQYLTDGDLAQNNAGWQWSAGCGCDAQPYFRVFNPVTQGKKFDPEGQYVRRWVPELRALPDRYIHSPWEAPPKVLAEASLVLGAHYPSPIVDHAFARKRFLMQAELRTKRT